MELLIAAVAGGFIATFLTVAYAQWRKNEKARALRQIIAAANRVKSMTDGGDAVEAAKREAEEKVLAQQAHDAVATL